MFSDTFLVGIAIVAVTTLIAAIGVLSDTRGRRNLKRFLLFLVIVGSVALGHREYQHDQALKNERQRTENAVKLAESSGTMAAEEMTHRTTEEKAHREALGQCVEDRKRAALAQENLVSQIFSLEGRIDEIEKLAVATKQVDIADTARTTKLESSRAFVKLAKQESWMDEREIFEMEKLLNKDTPLTLAQLALIGANLKVKYMSASKE